MVQVLLPSTQPIVGANDTLFLNPETWDLAVDSSGNIGSIFGAYAIAQDVASTVRLFKGELWYDTTQGVPYFKQILGELPPVGFLAAKFAAAGDTVPGVQSIKVTLNPVTSKRILTGKLEITNTGGTISVIEGQIGSLWYINAAAALQ